MKKAFAVFLIVLWFALIAFAMFVPKIFGNLGLIVWAIVSFATGVAIQVVTDDL